MRVPYCSHDGFTPPRSLSGGIHVTLHAPSPARSSTANAAKVLLVDDDPQLRRALRTILASAGCTVLEAMTGEEALDKVDQEGPVDVILLDLKMPGIGGLEACRRLRENIHTPILVISVRREREDKAQATDAGADDYLVKPFGVQELLSRIQVLLRMAGTFNSLRAFES
jgi:two-component system, OmpR family, KDP operon response regulator KdpE